MMTISHSKIVSLTQLKLLSVFIVFFSVFLLKKQRELQIFSRAVFPPILLPPNLFLFKRKLKAFSWVKKNAPTIKTDFIIGINDEMKSIIESEIKLKFKIVKLKNFAENKIVSKSVLSRKRQENIQIVLKKLPCCAEVIEAIMKMNFQFLDCDILRKIRYICATEDEIEMIKKAEKGRKNSLSEQILLRLSIFPNLKDRLNLMIFRLEFDKNMNEIIQIINFLNSAFDSVLKNEKFLRILEIILCVGNILNKNTELGSAKGFSILSLERLKYVYSNEKESLLLTIIKLMQKLYPNSIPLKFCQINNVIGLKEKDIILRIEEKKMLLSLLENHLKIKKSQFDLFNSTMTDFQKKAIFQFNQIYSNYFLFKKKFKEKTNEKIECNEFFAAIYNFSCEYNFQEKILKKLIFNQKFQKNNKKIQKNPKIPNFDFDKIIEKSTKIFNFDQKIEKKQKNQRRKNSCEKAIELALARRRYWLKEEFCTANTISPIRLSENIDV